MSGVYSSGVNIAKNRKVWLTYHRIKGRCNNPLNADYPDYGGRGIRCLWETSGDFVRDMAGLYAKAQRKWPSERLSIERLDFNGHYEKNNCSWIPVRLQAKNRRSNRIIEFRGRRMILMDWAKELGISRGTLWNRISRLGWSVEEAFNE